MPSEILGQKVINSFPAYKEEPKASSQRGSFGPRGSHNLHAMYETPREGRGHKEDELAEDYPPSKRKKPGHASQAMVAVESEAQLRKPKKRHSKKKRQETASMAQNSEIMYVNSSAIGASAVGESYSSDAGGMLFTHVAKQAEAEESVTATKTQAPEDAASSVKENPE